MTFETLAALCLFGFVSSITPGPNNLMLMASGANFGFVRTIPHMLGISIGFLVLMVLVGGGLVEVFDRFPVIYTILKVLSVLYMLYLAWKIAQAAPVERGEAVGNPMTFLQAAAFQWVNPKAWAMALTAITVYAANVPPLILLGAATAFALVNFPSITVWVVMGQQMTGVFNNPTKLRLFNWSMAVLLIASLHPVLVSPN